MSKPNKLDPEELLFTLDQLQQTTEIMSKVVMRLKHQLLQIQAAEAPAPESKTSQEQPTTTKPLDRRLH
ncbi:MAG TPA: hypothetical protein VIC08_09510 [Cellvibrionaceae bacterium]